MPSSILENVRLKTFLPRGLGRCIQNVWIITIEEMINHSEIDMYIDIEIRISKVLTDLSCIVSIHIIYSWTELNKFMKNI